MGFFLEPTRTTTDSAFQLPAGSLADHIFEHRNFTRQVNHQQAKIGRIIDMQVIELVTVNIQNQTLLGRNIDTTVGAYA